MTDDDLKTWIRAYLNADDSTDFKNYSESLRKTDLKRFVWFEKEMARLAGISGGRVLDVGCGFGWGAAALSLSQGCTVIASDIRKEMTDTVARCTQKLQAQGAPISIEPLTGDICTLNLPDNAFDAVICNQTIEHVHDLEEMFRVCYRVLKPGRTLLATNDNNVRNRKKLAENEAMWARRDSDWALINEIKQIRPIENQFIEPYAVMREKIVRAANPQLTDQQVASIVQATAGLTRKEIEPLAASYTPTTTLPQRPPHSWCRNPIDGEYCERLLDPSQLLELTRSIGFRSTTRHGFRRTPLNWINGIGIGFINDLLYEVNPFFILVATKPS